MISHIFSTILMALGVATGNVSTNVYKGGNAFNNEIKKPIQKTTENTNTTIQYEEVSQITISEYNKQAYKYYLVNAGNNYEQTPNYSNAYYNIYNTTYVYPYKEGNSCYFMQVAIYEITTYFNFNATTIILNNYTRIISTNNTNFNWWVVVDDFIPNIDIKEYIDLTLTPGNIDLIRQMRSNNSIKTFRTTYDEATGYNTGYQDANDNDSYTISSIQANETIQVVMSKYIGFDLASPYNFSNYTGGIEPDHITIQGQAIIPDLNYEVIDIPQVMYTILTMPFSFISTAFNLTLWGGTKYALNIGNVILTIISALILFWIIKKVIK